MSDPPSEAGSATVGAYERDARSYAAARPEVSAEMMEFLQRFVDRIAHDGPILEIGSGPGFEAARLRTWGLDVRTSDISPAFVAMLRGKGFDAAVLDPARDDLGGPYAGVLALACLLHVPRADLGAVLTRLRDATVPGGVLAVTLKAGDGEGWSTHGAVRSPRWFTYWRSEPLRQVLFEAGWHVEDCQEVDGTHEAGTGWLMVQATCS